VCRRTNAIAVSTVMALGLASAGQAAPVLLADGTPITLRLLQELRSGREPPGTVVPLECADTVLGPDGELLVAPKAHATGEVTVSRKAGWYRMCGKLDFSPRGVEAVDGQLTGLRFSLGKTTEGRGTWSLESRWVGPPPLEVLVRGQDVTYPAGLEFVAYVDGDCTVEPGVPPFPGVRPVRVTDTTVLPVVVGGMRPRRALVAFRAENPNVEVGLRCAHVAVDAVSGLQAARGGTNWSTRVSNPEQTIYWLPPNTTRLFVKPIQVRGAWDRCVVHVAQAWVGWDGMKAEPKLTVIAVSKTEGAARVTGRVRNESPEATGVELAAVLRDGGRVVGAAYQYVNLLRPNATAKFSLEVAGECRGEVEACASAGPCGGETR